jgi:hypothetical protein
MLVSLTFFFYKTILRKAICFIHWIRQATFLRVKEKTEISKVIAPANQRGGMGK